MTPAERCRNPLKTGCEGSDIAVYIQIGSERLPICRSCWVMLAEQDIEWDEDGIRVKGEPDAPTFKLTRRHARN